ncbi:Tar (HIV-1) RNA binding protein 1, partial [Blyttiomyces sp. JEL0837]
VVGEDTYLAIVNSIFARIESLSNPAEWSASDIEILLSACIARGKIKDDNIFDRVVLSRAFSTAGSSALRESKVYQQVVESACKLSYHQPATFGIATLNRIQSSLLNSMYNPSASQSTSSTVHMEPEDGDVRLDAYYDDKDVQDYHELVNTREFLQPHKISSIPESKPSTSPWSLDSSLSVLYRLLEEGNTHDHLIQQSSLEPWTKRLEQIFIIAVGLMTGCGQPTVRRRIAAEVLPALFKWDSASTVAEKTSSETTKKGSSRRKQWCEIIWLRLSQTRGLPDCQESRVLKGEMLSCLCSVFDFFFGLVVSDEVEIEVGKGKGKEKGKRKAAKVKGVVKRDEGGGRQEFGFGGIEEMGIDLRKEKVFWESIQEGLTSNDPLLDKFSVFLVKRIVDFSKRYDNKCITDRPWTKYFAWSSEKTQDLQQKWDEYCNYLEIINEAGTHLVEPILPKIQKIVAEGREGGMHTSWWIVLVNRGIFNTVISIRKKVLEYLITNTEPSALETLRDNPDFLLGRLLPQLDLLALYSVPGLGSFVSPFGEAVKGFIYRIVSVLETESARTEFIQQAILTAVKFSTRVASLFFFMGLYDVAVDPVYANFRPLRRRELIATRDLVLSERSVTVWTKPDSRRLLRMLSIGIFTRFVDRKDISLSDVMTYLAAMIGTDPKPFGSEEYILVRLWCYKGFGDVVENKNGEWFANQLAGMVREFIEVKGAESDVMEIRQADNLALMLSYLLPDTIHGSFLQTALDPMLRRLERLQFGSVYSAPGTSTRTLYLLSSIMTVFGKVIAPVRGGKSVGTTLAVVPELSKTLLEAVNCAASDLVGTGVTVNKASGSAGFTFEKWDALASLLTNAVDGTSVGASGSPMLIEAGTSLVNLMALLESWYEKAWGCLRSTDEETIQRQNAKYAALVLLTVVFNAAGGLSLWNLRYLDKDSIMFLISKVALVKVLNTEEDRNANWSDLQNRFQVVQNVCLRSLMRYTTVRQSRVSRPEVAVSQASKEVFTFSVAALNDASHSTANHIMDLIASVLSTGVKVADEDMVACIKGGLELVTENWTNAKYFLKLVKSFATVAFHENILGGDYGDTVTEAVKEASNQFLAWGELKMTIVPQLATNCLGFWIRGTDPTHSQSESALRSLSRYNKVFVSLLLYGPSRDKDKEENKLDATISYKLKSRDPQSNLTASDFEDIEGTAEINFNCKDYATRLQANDLLSRLDPSIDSHRKCGIKVLEYLLEIHMSGKLLAKFSFTPEHRQQWAVQRILLVHPKTLLIVWERLRKYDRRAHAVASLLSILTHVGPHLLEAHRLAFYRTLFDTLLPWMTSNHFTIRLFAQYVFYRAWCDCQKPGESAELKVASESKVVIALANFLQQNSDCIKHRQKADKLYFLGGGFHPLEDVTIEFVFRGGLTVANITAEERISPRAFERINSKPGRKIKLNHELSRKQLWALSAGDFEALILEGEGGTVDGPENRVRNSLIVVASLISKAPNLGGLCRTCEIFNAELLVVSNLRIREDPTFLSTAVTSDKWMPMQEVRVPDLMSYLKSMKENNYSLLGIEQATTSVSLENFEFPKQCVLLLGMEKEGIPAEYMPLLDHILEIPQAGLIRSLNVHVSGALIVWEYTRQRLIKG